MVNKLQILFIAPLPPPIDGQTKASEQALLALRSSGHKISIVNTHRKRGLSLSALSRLHRLFELPRIFIEILNRKSRVDAIYISLSESLLGNFKDILIYIILLGRLDKVTLHMLGGSGMSNLLKRGRFLSYINKLFMQRMRGVIVEGQTGLAIFGEHFNKKNIKIVPNFVDDYLLTDDCDVRNKFDRKPLQILYLSNMIIEKGYLDLLDGFLSLPFEIRSNYRLKFVGEFPEESDKNSFLKRINSYSDIEYLGKFIDGEEKKRLYMSSHIFCLPTYYPYEGQPISILEAYATGCLVLTTRHGGIPDIFIDGDNGFFVDFKNPISIRNTLAIILHDLTRQVSIAIKNAKLANQKYRCDRYRCDLIKVIAN